MIANYKIKLAVQQVHIGCKHCFVSDAYNTWFIHL